MATLKQLWEQSGQTPGLKVMLPMWKKDYFVIMGKSPLKDEFYGYYSYGSADTWNDNETCWDFYIEPTAKKKLLAWLIFDNNSGEYFLKFSETQPISVCFGGGYIRAPHLDFEVDAKDEIKGFKK